MNSRISTLAAIASILGLTVPLGIGLYEYVWGSGQVSLFPIVVSLVAALIIVIFLFIFQASSNLKLWKRLNLIKRRSDRVNLANSNYIFILDEVISGFRSVTDQFKDRIFEIDNVRTTISESDEEILEAIEIEIENIRKTNDMYYLFFVDNVKAVFDSFTGDNCAVCIKILDMDEWDDGVGAEGEFEEQNANRTKTEVLVKTLMRDSKSYVSRRTSDFTNYQYPYYENTAFKTILSPNNEQMHYACDNLGKERTYQNFNPNWGRLYNATLVVPIHLRTGPNDMNSNIVGFICVDNKTGNLDNLAAVNMLASFADILYTHMDSLNICMNALEIRRDQLNANKTQ